MKLLKIIMPFLLLPVLAACEEDVDLVSETYYDIAGVYRLESMKFKEPRAVDLNGDGISSEDILSELMMFANFENNLNQMRPVVRGKGAGWGNDMSEINGSGKVSLKICLQTYAGWSYNDVTTEWLHCDMGFTIRPNGFLTIEPYEKDGVRGEISFPMQDVMIFTINYAFYDCATHSICSEVSEWRYVRI